MFRISLSTVMGGVLLGLVYPALLFAQQVPTPAVATDTLPPASTTTAEVVVTATRTELTLGEVPQPISIIGREQLRQMGAQRLDAVLAEQTGVVLTNDHGTGLQLQGIDDDYILILIDGEPLVGRTAGTLDLARITVENIERIELLKGPASSLYGSEALGGVINIITRKPAQQPTVDLRARYGSNETADGGLSAGLRNKGLSSQLSLNRYSSAGYDLAPETPGVTVAPFQNYTGSLKLGYTPGARWLAEVSLRGFAENQDVLLADISNAIITGTGQIREFNLHPSVSYLPNDRLRIRAHHYSTRYQTEETLNYADSGLLYDASFFAQTFQRPEVQADLQLGTNHTLTMGTGAILETIEATRYDQKQHQQTYYAFAQSFWQPTQLLTVITGMRYDAPSAYADQLSPKVSVGYKVASWVTVQGSVGVGFKAPDFRQLYLNFTNASAGYSVFGVRQAVPLVEQLDAAGQISAYFIPLSSFVADLKPESSIAFNLGARVKSASGRYKASINLFRNEISNLIETFALASKTNSQNVFSYRNLSEIITQGVEIDGSWQVRDGFSVSAGYQFLYTADRDVLAKLDAGSYYRRNAQGIDVQLKRSDYAGLLSRSTHTANLRLFFSEAKTGLEASVRALYRSRFGLGDTNGNAILDDYDTFAKGYATLNLNLGKTFYKKLTLQLGADNLLDYTDQANLPNLPGRLLYATALLRLQGNSGN